MTMLRNPWRQWFGWRDRALRAERERDEARRQRDEASQDCATMRGWRDEAEQQVAKLKRDLDNLDKPKHYAPGVVADPPQPEARKPKLHSSQPGSKDRAADFLREYTERSIANYKAERDAFDDEAERLGVLKEEYRLDLEATEQRLSKAQRRLGEATELLRGIVEDDCGKLRARAWLRGFHPVNGSVTDSVWTKPAEADEAEADPRDQGWDPEAF